MATWNIQFRGSKLHYVDRDSMDEDFEKKVPFTYQVVLALMNYKRTVADFGKCGGDFEAKYGVRDVGNCVIDSAFNSVSAEKCNEKYPVPCADGECKSTYVQCLRDLSKQAKLKKQSLKRKDGAEEKWEDTVSDKYTPFSPKKFKQKNKDAPAIYQNI